MVYCFENIYFVYNICYRQEEFIKNKSKSKKIKFFYKNY